MKLAQNKFSCIEDNFYIKLTLFIVNSYTFLHVGFNSQLEKLRKCDNYKLLTKNVK